MLIVTVTCVVRQSGNKKRTKEFKIIFFSLFLHKQLRYVYDFETMFEKLLMICFVKS